METGLYMRFPDFLVLSVMRRQAKPYRRSADRPRMPQLSAGELHSNTDVQ